MKLGKISTILLAVYLILVGITHFIDFSVDGTILAALALATGVLILINK